jgi:SAM-dependent methyltransferase
VNPKETVRRGYDAVSYRYRADDADADADQYAPWIARVRAEVPAGGSVLDLGCGCGVPVAGALAGDYDVLGVDLSGVQIERARGLVPDAAFIQADMTTLEHPDGSWDAVLALYSMIHVPVDDQPRLIDRIHHWLRPGGLFLATLGHRACEGTEERWLGADAPMWWSQADEATYRSWLTETGFTVREQRYVREGDTGHSLVVALA